MAELEYGCQRGQRYRTLYEAAYHFLDGDLAGRLTAQRYLNASTAIYHGEVVSMGYIPMIYSTPELIRFEEIAHATYGILDTITERYCTDAAYRSLFGFSPLLEYLILLPTGYDISIPITRIDIFYKLESGDFKFCEFNTDGSSAMNEDREICNSLGLSTTFSHASEALRLSEDVYLFPQELFDPWVETFLDIYAHSTHRNPSGTPLVAIVDYLEKTTIHELEEFRTRFEQTGLRCLICDMRSLEYKNGILFGTDISPTHPNNKTPVILDAIYRRAVTSDIMEDLGAMVGDGATAAQDRLPHVSLEQELITPEVLANVQQAQGAIALIAAARDEAVCLIGGFKTQVAHSKTIFRMLHHPQTHAFLSVEQRNFIERHVPYTAELTKETASTLDALHNKDRYIIKPIDGYGTRGVFAGLNHSPAEWEPLLEERYGTGYVLQEYCQQYPCPNTLPVPIDALRKMSSSSDSDVELLMQSSSFARQQLIPYNVLTGLFVYGGQFSGVYVRAGTDALIVGFRGGVTLGTFIACESPTTLFSKGNDEDLYLAKVNSNLPVRLRPL